MPAHKFEQVRDGKIVLEKKNEKFEKIKDKLEVGKNRKNKVDELKISKNKNKRNMKEKLEEIEKREKIPKKKNKRIGRKLKSKVGNMMAIKIRLRRMKYRLLMHRTAKKGEFGENKWIVQVARSRF